MTHPLVSQYQAAHNTVTGRSGGERTLSLAEPSRGGTHRMCGRVVVAYHCSALAASHIGGATLPPLNF